MQLAFDRFYRDRGVRTYSQLASPRLWSVRELPKDSVVHFLGGESEKFPDPAGIYVQFAKRKILLRNVLDLLPENNSQGKKLFNHKNEITKFVAKNNFFINFIKPLSDAKEPTQLVFVNYNLIKFAYRYNENHPLTPHKKWLDANNALWGEINECCKHAQKEHFIDVNLPELLPAKSKLDMYSVALNAQIEDFFDTPEAKFILDFWKWLNPETRSTSCMGKVEVNNLKHVNLLFHVKDGRSAILNLGFMNSWIEGQINQTDRPKVSQMPPNQLRMYFLKFLIVLQNLSVELLQSERESMLDKEDDSQRSSDELGDDEQRNLTDRTGSEDGEGDIEEETGESSTNLDLGSDAFNLSSKIVSKGTNSIKASSKVSGAKEVSNEGEPETPRDSLDDIEKDIQALEDLNDRRERLNSLEVKSEGEIDLEIDQKPEEILAEINQPKRPEERLLQSLDVEVVKKNISAADYRKVVKTLEDQKTAPDPFGSGKTLLEMTTITKEDLAFDEEKTKLVGDERAIDPSMLESVVESLDRDYIKKTMNKDVISTIMAIQSAKVLVTDIETEEHNSALGAFVTHALTLKPLNGRTSVIRIKYPKVSEDGTFVSNGVRYHLRRQRADLPIRLIAPGKVSLSSYYGTKLFVYRSPKIADSMLAPVQKLLTLASNGESETIHSVRPANVLDRSLKAPFIYNAFGENYKSFSVKHPIFGNLLLDFEYKKRSELVSDPSVLTTLEKDGAIVVGKTQKGRPIYVAKDNHFYAKLENGIQPLGDIFDIVGLDRLDAPVDFAITKVMGNAIPVGFILGRFLGLKKLLKMSGARHRLVKARKQKNLQPYEYAVTFEDVSLILDRRDEKATLLFGGFEKYKYIKAFPIAAYEEKEVFEDIFDSMGMNMGVIREIELLESSFVDPITKTVLEEMKEPVTFLGLLDRACEMLLKYEAPESQDFAFQQIKSYERFPGAIYKQLMKSIRTFRNKNISGRSKIEMSPFAVSQAIQEDRGVKTCEDINPIKNLAMHESVTFAGDGGRDKDTFTAEARAFGLNDAGVISEASVDSSMVGYNVFMSSNPQIKNLRGLRKEGKLPEQASSYLSPSLLVAVGAQHDDQKRNVFVSIQNAHTIACNGYYQPYVQTYAETVLAQRTDDLFCYSAKEDGKVLSVSPKGILVEYKSGEKRGVELGRRYGNAEGSTYPHDIVTHMQEGEKFTKGDVIAYNTGFWEQDYANPRRVVLKMSRMVMTAFEESAVTHEDSCSLHEDVTKTMVAKTTKVKSYIVNFNQNLHEVQKPGTTLEPDSILMSIEDEITMGTNLFDAESSAILGKLSRMNPRSSYTGTLDKIEVFYHGDKADMTPSIKALADRSDKAMVESCKARGETPYTGRVSGDYRVKGKNLLLDTAEIKFYITVDNDTSAGDKFVFANQLKTTAGQIFKHDVFTEDGIKIEAKFGGRSAIKRIVNSYAIEGTTTMLLMLEEKDIVDMYFK